MEEDKTIDWETFVKSQLHWIRVVYKIVGRQENLQEIYNLYKEFADAVDAGVLAYKRNRERREDRLQTYKADIDRKASGCIQKLAYRISQLESYKEKYRDMCPEILLCLKSSWIATSLLSTSWKAKSMN